MPETSTPIAVRSHDGHLMALGAADVIRAAFNGAATLTVTSGKVAGDRIRLRPAQRYGEQGWAMYSDAYTTEHPEFGTVIAAYVDDTPDGLGEAPKTRAILGRQLRSSIAADARANDEERRIIAEGDR